MAQPFPCLPFAVGRRSLSHHLLQRTFVPELLVLHPTGLLLVPEAFLESPVLQGVRLASTIAPDHPRGAQPLPGTVATVPSQPGMAGLCWATLCWGH